MTRLTSSQIVTMMYGKATVALDLLKADQVEAAKSALTNLITTAEQYHERGMGHGSRH